MALKWWLCCCRPLIIELAVLRSTDDILSSFLRFRPVLIELPHIASLRDDEREVIALRSNDGISWHEHPVTASEIVGSLLKFAGELSYSNYYCIKYNLLKANSDNFKTCTVR